VGNVRAGKCNFRARWRSQLLLVFLSSVLAPRPHMHISCKCYKMATAVPFPKIQVPSSEIREWEWERGTPSICVVFIRFAIAAISFGGTLGFAWLLWKTHLGRFLAGKHLEDERLNSGLFFIFYLMQIMPGACEKKEYLTPFEWQLRQVCALFTLEIVRSENLVTKCWEYLPALNKVGARRCLSPNRPKAENILNSHLFCIEYRNGESISHAYAANQYALRCKYVASCVCVCVHFHSHTHTHICIYVVQIKWRQQARTILYLCKFISVTFPPLN